MIKSNYLLPVTVCALLVFVALAPEITTVGQVSRRVGFTLAAVASGYFIIRYRMRSRHYRRLKTAFSRKRKLTL